MRLQRQAQWLALEAFDHHEQAWPGGKQAVGRIGRVRDPGQRKTRHHRFPRQHLTRKSLCHRLRTGHLRHLRRQPPAPFGPRLRGLRRCHSGQAPGRVHQPPRQQFLLTGEPGTLQQRGGREHVKGNVHPQVVSRWHEKSKRAAHASRPIHRGFKMRHERRASI